MRFLLGKTGGVLNNGKTAACSDLVRGVLMKSLGLALGGGGLKGLAHIGVLEVLEDNHIEVSMLSGTSIGSIIASLYACGISAYEMEALALEIKPGDYIDYNVSGLIMYLASRLRPGFKYNLNGIIKGHKLEKMINNLTNSRSLSNIKIPLSIIACDIDTGREIVFTNSNKLTPRHDTIIINHALLSTAIRCSTAIPVTFVPRRYKGMQVVDGGIKSIVPVWVLEPMGADFTLAINLGQKVYTQKVAGIPQIVSRTIDILTFQTSDTEEKLFADMLIFPEIKDVDLDDLKQAQNIIKQGRVAMKKRIKTLIRLLEE